MRIKSILCVIPLLFLSCDEAEEQNAEDCAGIVGGNTICGCTDSDATNYNSEATYDDGSCEYDPNMDCAGIVGGNSICGCMDESAVNYDPAANQMTEAVNTMMVRCMLCGRRKLKEQERCGL